MQGPCLGSQSNWLYHHAKDAEDDGDRGCVLIGWVTRPCGALLSA